MRARWGELPSRCGVTCTGAGSEAHRVRYGCDGPAEPGPWTTPCWRCGSRVDAECPFCRGSRRVPFNRCAGRIVDARTVRLLDVLLAYHEHGVLPVRGGILEQARPFVRALDFFLPEWQACESRAVERARASVPSDPRRNG